MPPYPDNCGILTRDNNFEPVFRAWLDVSEEYARAWEHGIDFHWSYRERAHISMLAAAIWRAGGVALEEYGTQKDREGDPYSGRCDLCFKLGKYPSDQGYVAEAKHVHVHINALRSRPKELESELQKTMNWACDSVTCAEPGEIGLGIVFVTFRVAKPAQADHRKIKITECIGVTKRFHKILKCHTTFWQFPARANDPSDDFCLYPGTAAFIKLRRR